jgi:hypothetical protein
MVKHMEIRKVFARSPAALLLGLALYGAAIGAVMAVVSTEPNHALMYIDGSGLESATLEVGDCMGLRMKVRFKGTSDYVDVSNSPNTTFFTDPPRGEFEGKQFCATANTANKTFTIYGRYRDPITGVSVTDTVIVTVRPEHEIVYANDFSQGAGGGSSKGPVVAAWSSAATDFAPTGRYGPFLGQFGNSAVTLTLTGLPPHSSVSLSLKLFVIRSWAGNIDIPEYGPDLWEFGAVAGPLFLRTTFSNHLDHGQSFPGSYPSSFPAQSGALEINTLGYDFFGDTIYQLERTFAHSGSTLTLYFAGSGLQNISDESWGLDDIVVAVRPR